MQDVEVMIGNTMVVAASVGPWQIVLIAFVVVYLLGILSLWMILKTLRNNKRKD